MSRIKFLNATILYCEINISISLNEIIVFVSLGNLSISWASVCWYLYVLLVKAKNYKEPSWSWSYYDSWIYIYLCNQCLSPLTLWVRIPLRCGMLIQHYVIKFVVFSNNKTEILLQVALNIITLTSCCGHGSSSNERGCFPFI